LQARRRAERLRLEKESWQIMQNGAVEILFLATKNVNPPLYSAYHWLKEKNAVQVQVVDAFYRAYQIIPDRSHPVMQQLITGGLILSAVKVQQR
uniref:tRNA (adenine(58)-N(1))-methyltransferase non-catalytic subunit TRM6 n=1 Tax=Gongylonema pulchrum TaxID=637853 RepID=A0A183E6C2_9BILA